MSSMPRPRKPYVHREKDRHGNTRWYFRRGKGPRTRLPGEFESNEWLEAYDKAYKGEKAEQAARAGKGTLKWLCERYYRSAAYVGLAPSTQRMRRNILKKACETGGNLYLSQIDRQMIANGRDRRAKKPAAALNYMKVMGYLFDFAVDAGYVKENPVIGVKKPKQTGGGLPPWTSEDVVKYLETHKIGTMAHLAMWLFLGAGLSRADAWQIGPQHSKDGMLLWDREKTGTPQYIPIVPPLQAAIDACPTKQLAFLLTEHGRPFKSAAGLGNKMAKWCEAAKIGKRAHGLRKLSATLLAENGGTHSELRAIYGWKSDKMPSYYTQSANAKKLAESAGKKMAETILFPHPVSSEGSS